MNKHYDLTHLHGLLLFFLFILVLGAGYLLIQRSAAQMPERKEVAPVPTIDIANKAFFNQTLASSGISLNSIGYHAFTPDGKYFVFSGINDADEVPAKTYLLRLSDEDITPLPGVLLGNISDSRIIILTEGENIVIYDIASGISKRIPNFDNVRTGSLSPDGRTYVFNTSQGIRSYDMERDVVSVVSNSQYDGATAWYADSQYMLGYHDTGENLAQTGKGRAFGRWNIPAKTFEPIADGVIQQKTIRNVTWIEPGKIARVNAGYDDGSFDTLIDIHTGESVDLGDTSSALAGGIKEDPSRGLFALINTDDSIKATIYEGLEKVAQTSILPEYIRSYVQILDDHTLLYLRQRITPNGPRNIVELIKLDVATGIVTPVKTFSAPFAVLSLAPDQKTWVVSAGNRFYSGVLE